MFVESKCKGSSDISDQAVLESEQAREIFKILFKKLKHVKVSICYSGNNCYCFE